MSKLLPKRGIPRTGVAVCARRHGPKLSDLMEKLVRQTGLEGPALTLIVIPNGWSASELNRFESEVSVRPLLRHNVVVRPEPTVGIPYARNRALEVAQQANLEWLAFIDDDCVPNNCWLSEMFNVVAETQADVVASSWSIVPDGEKSRFLPSYVFGDKTYEIDGIKIQDKQRLVTAYTRSVLFDVSPGSIVNRYNLRFDESRTLLGGSDVLFFQELARLGAKLVFSGGAKVVEKFSGQRLSLRWWFWRKYRNSQFIFERGETSINNILIGASKIVRTLLIYALAAVIPSLRKRGGTFSEAIGHVVLSAAPLLGLVGYRLYRYQSYASREVPHPIGSNR